MNCTLDFEFLRSQVIRADANMIVGAILVVGGIVVVNGKPHVTTAVKSEVTIAPAAK